MQGFVEEIVGKYNGNVSAVIGLLGSCWDQVHSLQAFWNSLMEQFAGFREVDGYGIEEFRFVECDLVKIHAYFDTESRFLFLLLDSPFYNAPFQRYELKNMILDPDLLLNAESAANNAIFWFFLVCSHIFLLNPTFAFDFEWISMFKLMQMRKRDFLMANPDISLSSPPKLSMIFPVDSADDFEGKEEKSDSGKDSSRTSQLEDFVKASLQKHNLKIDSVETSKKVTSRLSSASSYTRLGNQMDQLFVMNSKTENFIYIPRNFLQASDHPRSYLQILNSKAKSELNIKQWYELAERIFAVLSSNKFPTAPKDHHTVLQHDSALFSALSSKLLITKLQKIQSSKFQNRR